MLVVAKMVGRGRPSLHVLIPVLLPTLTRAMVGKLVFLTAV